jgi:hypothetical protein
MLPTRSARGEFFSPPPSLAYGPGALIAIGYRSTAATTTALDPAQSEQWCCWIGRRRIISGSAEIAAIRAVSAMQLDDQRPRENAC